MRGNEGETGGGEVRKVKDSICFLSEERKHIRPDQTKRDSDTLPCAFFFFFVFLYSKAFPTHGLVVT